MDKKASDWFVNAFERESLYKTDDKTRKETEDLFLDAINKKQYPDKDTKSASPKEKSNALDYHGKTVSQVEPKLESDIRSARQKGLSEFQVITGSGKHSPGSYSPLVSEVERILENRQGQWKIEFKKGDGCFKIWLK